MRKKEFAARISKQAKSLQQMNAYFREHPDECVYIHWRDDNPFVLPHKMTRQEAREGGFDSVINTIKLSSILQ